MGRVSTVVFSELMKLFCALFSQCVKQEGQEGGYERTSDVYKDLVALLKSRSPHFAANIIEQVKSKLSSAHEEILFVALSLSSGGEHVWVF